MIRLINKKNNIVITDFEIINCVANSIDPFTKKNIFGISYELKTKLLKIAENFNKTINQPQIINKLNEYKKINYENFQVPIDENGEILTDINLLKKLQVLRKSISDKNNFPPFCICSNKTLVSIATIKPMTKEDFLNIKGIKNKWYNLYGNAFLKIIKES